MARFEKFENVDTLNDLIQLRNNSKKTTCIEMSDNTQKNPPSLLFQLNNNKMSEEDWAMAYGLRRCRLCGYNEGPLICPSNCYGAKKTLKNEDDNKEKK